MDLLAVACLSVRAHSRVLRVMNAVNPWYLHTLKERRGAFSAHCLSEVVPCRQLICSKAAACSYPLLCLEADVPESRSEDPPDTEKPGLMETQTSHRRFLLYWEALNIDVGDTAQESISRLNSGVHITQHAE